MPTSRSVSAGILQRTGTPVDSSLLVSLPAIEAIHVDWRSGVQLRSQRVSAEQARHLDLTPTSITAFMLGLNSRIATFSVQRRINEYPDEAMLAILPGVTLQQLWQSLGTAERALQLISAMVVAAGHGLAGGAAGLDPAGAAARDGDPACHRGAAGLHRRPAGGGGGGDQRGGLRAGAGAAGGRQHGRARLGPGHLRPVDHPCLAGRPRAGLGGRRAGDQRGGRAGAGVAGLPAHLADGLSPGG
jgi:hypothetical protein